MKPKAFVHVHLAFLFELLVLGNLDLLLYGLYLGLLLAEVFEGLVKLPLKVSYQLGLLDGGFPIC